MASAKKARKGTTVNPAIRLSTLRPRLEQLRGTALPADNQGRVAQLDTLTDGLKPVAFLPTLIAVAAIEPAGQLSLAMAEWLRERAYLQPLQELASRYTLAPDQQQLALQWLEQGGVNIEGLTMVEDWDAFYAAYYAGTQFQGALGIFCYANPKRLRVQGLSLLIDHEPPWYGAIKDVAVFGQRDPERASESYVAMWREQGSEPEELDAGEAKYRVLAALEANRTRGIRLPRDLVAARDQFLRMVLPLPDDEGTPAFSAEEFDELARTGEPAEVIQRREQLLGYQTRMPDGSIVRIQRPPEDF